MENRNSSAWMAENRTETKELNIHLINCIFTLNFQVELGLFCPTATNTRKKDIIN